VPEYLSKKSRTWECLAFSVLTCASPVRDLHRWLRDDNLFQRRDIKQDATEVRKVLSLTFKKTVRFNTTEMRS